MTSAPLTVVDGALPVVRPEPDLLDAVAADDATTARWPDRLRRVEALAAARRRRREPVDRAGARSSSTSWSGRGVREAVLSPGSRNAPLSFALHAADRAGRLRLHVRIDERTRRLPRPRAGQGLRAAGRRW